MSRSGVTVNIAVNPGGSAVRIVDGMQITASAPGSPAPRSFHSPLAAPMLDEWARLRRSAAVRGRLATGPLAALVEQARTEFPDQHPLDAVLHTCGFLEPPTPASDRAMLDLVEAARTDELAARIALHRILPALVAIARRRAPLRGGADHAFADVVGSAWIAIRTYPVERRPLKVVANVVRDAEYLAFVQPARLKWAGEHVGLPDGRPRAAARLDGNPADSAPHPIDDVVEVLTEATRSGVAPDDVRFAAAWASGAANGELARTFGCCDRTVRNRRREVAWRLRQVALAA